MRNAPHPGRLPAVRASPEFRTERRARRIFAVVQRLLEYAVALFLVVFGGMTLFSTGQELLATVQRHQDLSVAITQGVDAVLFTVILLEVLNTILSQAPVAQRLQEFLVVGLFSAVRYSLEIVASAQGTQAAHEAAALHGASRDVVINLAINAGGILILVVALWFVRTHLKAAPEVLGTVDTA